MSANISFKLGSPDLPSVFRAWLSLAFSLWAILSGRPAFPADLRPEEIVTVLPKDAIPAILSPTQEFLMIDDATGSTWDALTGKALHGALEGKRLKPLPATPSFWFGWVDHYPNTELFALAR